MLQSIYSVSVTYTWFEYSARSRLFYQGSSTSISAKDPPPDRLPTHIDSDRPGIGLLLEPWPRSRCQVTVLGVVTARHRRIHSRRAWLKGSPTNRPPLPLWIGAPIARFTSIYQRALSSDLFFSLSHLATYPVFCFTKDRL